MKKFVEMATIVENTAIIPEVWKMVFQAPKTASEAKAGQFVNVHRDGGQTFLRRPFGIVDADSLVWDDPMYPFLVYGVGVVVCALVLMPLKTALVARRATLVSAGIQFFAATVVVCMLMELAMGFMLNQPNAAGEYPLWDNSQLPFNILGQAWLVNDLALAAVAMLYTWIVYPLCQKALGKLPLRVMNLLAAVVVIGFVVLCAVKFA